MIIEKLNGVINFISKWKKGTCFYFTLHTEEYDRNEIEELQKSAITLN
jgi:K+-sensing histidine kinase KdpD